MTVSRVFAIALFSAMCAVGSVAASPVARGSKYSISPSKVKSVSLWAWGPSDHSRDADMIMLDGDLESSSTIERLRSDGKIVSCYMSAGTIENWRDDANKFDSGDKAKKYKGFGGTETWVCCV